jgi:hypothetical protein
LRRVLGDRGESRDADPSVDAAGWEVRHAANGAMWAREERERDRHATSRVVKKRGTEVHVRSTSSSVREIEQGATVPPPSSPHVAPSLPQDVGPSLKQFAIGEH